MLNELVIIERGAHRAGINTTLRHPAVKDARRIPTLLVQLDERGQVASVKPVPRQVTPWTLRDGQHNSFPFVQPKYPFWNMPADPQTEETLTAVLDKKNGKRNKILLDMGVKMSFALEAFKGWPGEGLLNRLRERRQQLESLANSDSEIVLATIDSFLLACDQPKDVGSEQLFHQLAERLLTALRQSPQDEWLEVAVALLIGSFDRKKKKWLCGGALLFEAAGKKRSIFDSRLIISVSDALSNPVDRVATTGGRTKATCALTGMNVRLLNGNFPQPNLKVLGQTYLYAKNKDIRANDRYGRFGTDAMPVGQDTVIRLAAALEALTSEGRKNVTWRSIPGESPKQSDLLLAFVETIPDTPIADSLVEEDFSAEEPEPTSHTTADSVAAFEKRTQRLIELVRAKVGMDVTRTPVQVTVFRKVDPANRKVVYATTPTVAALYEAGRTWVTGERNVPQWISLPVPFKGERKLRQMPPPHIAPLGLIAFSKQLFSRGGTGRTEIGGLPAGEALGLFLDPGTMAWRRAKRVLRLVLTRRAVLVTGVAHVHHTPACWERRSDMTRKFDRREALRTITVLGVLLHKLSRAKEVYMNEAAFKLGQLLAAADVVHAGYCADVRGGDIPPSLLGNQVFAMAQTAPSKALATLCRRWKPYDGWAKKAVRDAKRIEALASSSKKEDQQRGWDIRKAMRHAREMGPLAAELSATLGSCRIDDVFRAELLLGYMAGIPKAQREDTDTPNQEPTEEKEY